MQLAENSDDQHCFLWSVVGREGQGAVMLWGGSETFIKESENIYGESRCQNGPWRDDGACYISCCPGGCSIPFPTSLEVLPSVHHLYTAKQRHRNNRHNVVKHRMTFCEKGDCAHFPSLGSVALAGFDITCLQICAPFS